MTAKNYQKYLVKKDKLPKNVSDVKVRLKKNILSIDFERARQNDDDHIEIDLSRAKTGTTHNVEAKVKSKYFKNKVIYIDDIKNFGTLVVYTEDDRLRYYIHDNPNTHPLTRLITVKSKTFSLLTKRSIYLVYACLVENRYSLPIKKSYLTIGDDVKVLKKYPVFRSFPSKLKVITNSLFFDRIKLTPLLEGEPAINNRIEVSLDMGDDDIPALHTLTNGSKRIKAPKWYYAPHTQTRRNGYSISIRRNAHGGLNLVRRLLEPVELTLSFKFYESKVVSFLLYHIAHLVRRLSSKTVNIYFEKNANQSEEGVLEFCKKVENESQTSKNYFIIRKASPVYDHIKSEPCVVPNFTLKSYWLMYRANNVIASEVPQHMNILRSGNKYARLAPYSQTFVFLQHGVTYMKPQDKTTSFKKGREGEPDYIVVNSKKERDIVHDMLDINEERILNTGMLIFDDLDTNEITDKSPDIITIMLTWKPYEEHLQRFEDSSYYKTTMELYDLISKQTSSDNIRIVAHPKFKEHMMGTAIEGVLWHGPVSEALAGTKLLITDYSSVCYNVFYRGGAVVFYQPDVELYQQETGMLIPGDDEYIGKRVFNYRDIEALTRGYIIDSRVDLKNLRTHIHKHNYKTINEYDDSLNSKRLMESLGSISKL